MLFTGSFLFVGDNSGARLVKCIKVRGYNNGQIGDRILISIQKCRINKKKIKKGDLWDAVFINRRRVCRRLFGHSIYCAINCVAILKKGETKIPLATRILRSLPFEMRRRGYGRFVALSLTIQ